MISNPCHWHAFPPSPRTCATIVCRATTGRSAARAGRIIYVVARMSGISAERFLPSIRNVIGTFFTLRFLPISGANVRQNSLPYR
jgi:hypothetical protein